MKLPRSHTVFRQIHYDSYIKLVIKNVQIKKLIEEALKYEGTPLASENLKIFIDKIRLVEKESMKIPETY